MAKIPINAVWASNTTNKANMTSEEISKGIIFESAIESKYPNTILNQNSKALKELQESGALWIENKNGKVHKKNIRLSNLSPNATEADTDEIAFMKDTLNIKE